MAHFMTRLRHLRTERGITQEAVSIAIGIEKSTYQNYEQGLSGAPFHRLLQLADFFDVSLDYLSGHSDDRLSRAEQPKVAEPFAQQLRHLRKENKLTQRAVAEQLGIIPRTYIKYEHGEIIPPLDKLMKLADVFHVTVDTLVGCTDPRN